MKKKYIFTLVSFLLIMFLVKITYATDSEVPHFLSYQAIVYDDGGNLIADGDTAMTFQIVDAAGGVLFEEFQTVYILEGLASAIIGNGVDINNAPTNGIDPAIFPPNEQRFLEVAVENYLPETNMEFVSVPYAIYAEQSLTVKDGSITEDSIAEGAIKIEHFADGLVDDLAVVLTGTNGIVTVTDLDTLKTEYRQAEGAGQIGVTTGFTYSGGANIQEVLYDLDRAIQFRQAHLDAEIAARIDADAAHTNAISGVHGVSGNVVGTTGSQTLTSKTLESPIIHGGTVTGNLAVAAGVTIDGYDVGDRIANHEGRLVALEGDAPRPYTYAWGTVSTAPVETMVGHNASATFLGGGFGWWTLIRFDTPLPNANYALFFTPTEGGEVNLRSKTNAGFDVRIDREGFIGTGPFDFIVVTGP